MRSRKPLGSFAPQEIWRFVFPITSASIGMVLIVILDYLSGQTRWDLEMLFYVIAIMTGVLLSNVIVIRTPDLRESYRLLNAVLNGFGVGILPYLMPEHLLVVAHIIIILVAISIAINSGRAYGYIGLLTAFMLGLPHLLSVLRSPMRLLESGMPYLVAMVVMEAINRVKDTTQKHIQRLEIINKVSRQIMLSLETEQTISLLSATIQDALEADTYFIGTLRDREIHLDLFYDEGEYYNGTKVPLEGTLSGWVIKNQKPLFLPDLRKGTELEGVNVFVVGKAKTSLSWIGVPLTASNVRGLIALGSYQPNAFDNADMELLSNLAQHITLALDNTIRHAQVEEQARLDSLTGVYNHGYFLKKLAEQADEASQLNRELSLIMVDIDYFKQYNDTYGHLVGDRILKSLCTAIKHHIKPSDFVGRWGGEEFAIALPDASGEQAVQVAERIRQTVAALRVEDREQRTFPIPTMSQGIALYPWEANEIYRLIDLADRRLYIAKSRGRNQIEPGIEYWKTLQR